MSSACDALVQGATAGVSASLQAVDCLSAEATTSAFSRLFGTHGALLPALTVLLTLHIGVFAVLLLTGRTRLSIGSLTPRMITIGLVLTFVTSSVAYQGVVWNLAVGAPDEIAGVLMGSKGSATQMFAERIDILFGAITDAASNAAQSGAPRPASAGSFTPGNLMWLSALMLMLGTVGVLVTARIILAILLGLGPIFITMVLFNGTRGLFAGWLRSVVLTAIVPLIAVLAGATVVEFAVPVVSALQTEDGIDGRAAMALFVIAAVYCAIMALAIRTAASMVSGWRVFGGAEAGHKGSRTAPAAPLFQPAAALAPATTTAVPQRLRLLASGATAASAGTSNSTVIEGAVVSPRTRNMTIPATASGGATRPLQSSRARGIGSRFSGQATARKFKT
jgi:type IV secretion system protein VirB6